MATTAAAPPRRPSLRRPRPRDDPSLRCRPPPSEASAAEDPEATTGGEPPRRRRRRRVAASLVLAAWTAALLFGDDLLPSLGDLRGEGGYHGRHLLSSFDEDRLLRELDSDVVRDRASNGDAPPPPPMAPAPEIAPYALRDAIAEASAFSHTFCALLYDPETDGFVAYVPNEHDRSAASLKKLWNGVTNLSVMLRRTFPERFRKAEAGKGSDGERVPEFAVAVASGDHPHVKPSALPRAFPERAGGAGAGGAGGAPVLMFGSAFRDISLYPAMIPMPMPGLHLGCFEEWSRSKRVCAGFRPVAKDASNEATHGELAFGEALGLTWDDLIPQVVWRGTDFGYLPSLRRPRLIRPLGNGIEKMVERRKAEHPRLRDKKRAATEALRESYERLAPRWKGVVLTAPVPLLTSMHRLLVPGNALEQEAELEAEEGGTLPWANMKFSRHMVRGSLPPAIGSEAYKTYDDVGVATGAYLARPGLAKYKYHVDLGGGGGTTWTGTLEKLAVPGLLFHHVTPTKDYIHDRMQPWVHYVPVSHDLIDLKEKFDWAQSHPAEARAIAERATDLVREWGTPEGFGRLFEEDFAGPMRRVIEAYRPVSSNGTLGEGNESWKEVLEEGGMIPAMRCSGYTNNPASCRPLGGERDGVRQGVLMPR
ncbi:hypothetical protein ACHAWF_006729 [Thalassiosira exigua]